VGELAERRVELAAAARQTNSTRLLGQAAEAQAHDPVRAAQIGERVGSSAGTSGLVSSTREAASPRSGGASMSSRPAAGGSRGISRPV